MTHIPQLSLLALAEELLAGGAEGVALREVELLALQEFLDRADLQLRDLPAGGILEEAEPLQLTLLRITAGSV